jgi:glycosyltransferase involved in cell wall biosynthesis
MKVTLSCGGRFQAFDLAKQLEKRGHLERLITSYPRYPLRKYDVPLSKVRSVIIKELIDRAWRKAPAPLRDRFSTQYLSAEIFDRWASHLIPNSDVFVGWSGFSLNALRKAKARGIVTVLERCSSHIVTQMELLREEHERYGSGSGIRHPDVVAEIVRKELQEYEEADFIAVPSIFAKRSFVERGFPAERLIHVPFGVDLTRFRPGPKTDDVFRVVFGGGLTLRKGVHYLLRAMAELKLPDAELLLIGPVSDEIRPYLAKYAGTFRRMDYQPLDQLYRVYNTCSVFAMASIEEGLALVQPQAMACGLPIVATTNTGAEDIVRDGVDGFIVPIRDVEALKERLAYLHAHPEERTRMGKSALERVSTGFSWDDYGARMVSAYERALAGRAARPGRA